MSLDFNSKLILLKSPHQFYLDLVRDTNIGTTIKTSFISQTAVDPTTYQDLTPSARQEDQAPTDDVTQLAFPKVQPMKS